MNRKPERVYDATKRQYYFRWTIEDTASIFNSRWTTVETEPIFERTKDYVDRLERENANLRELVRDMWRFTGTACKKYPRLFDPAAQGGQMVQLNMIDAFEQRMHELGVSEWTL